jgi:hypothetical protein
MIQKFIPANRDQLYLFPPAKYQFMKRQLHNIVANHAIDSQTTICRSDVS